MDRSCVRPFQEMNEGDIFIREVQILLAYLIARALPHIDTMTGNWEFSQAVDCELAM